MANKLPYADPVRKYFVVSDKTYKNALKKFKKRNLNIKLNEMLEEL